MVLADVPKRELDEEMQRTLHGTRLHWVTRCGVEWNGVEQPRAGSKTRRRAMHCALTFSACDSLANGAMPRLPCLLCQAWGASLGKRFGDCGRCARQDRHPAAPRRGRGGEWGGWPGQLGYGLAAPVRVLVRAVKSE